MKRRDEEEMGISENVANRKAVTKAVLDYIELGESICADGGHDPRSFWLAVRVAAEDRGGLKEELKQPLPARKKAMSVAFNDNSKMPFGKYKGQLLGTIPDDYFIWFLEQPWCDKWPELVEYANCVGE